jgi:hypothetical protein
MKNGLPNRSSFYKIAFFTMVLLNVAFLFSGFMDRRNRMKVEEIDAERVNIIDPNGKAVMVLSNSRLIPGPSMNGKTYPREYADGRQFFSGILFYNPQGDEVGGLIYTGFPKDSGYYAMEHLSFDQWKQNQVVALQYVDNGRTQRAGLRIYDRPKRVSMDEIFDRFKARNALPKGSVAYDSILKEIKASAERGDNGTERMFIGSLDQEAQIQFRDQKGNVRLKIVVDEAGDARIVFLDEKGNIVKNLSGKN